MVFTKQKIKIFTDFANNCNNDHGIFPNGKELIISNNDKDPNSKNSWGISRIYRVPLEGGTPELITPKGHSFWHGISPDGKSILYTAFRDEEADVCQLRMLMCIPSVSEHVGRVLLKQFGSIYCLQDTYDSNA